MLENLIHIAKQQLADTFDGVPELQQANKDEALNITSQTILNSIMNQVKGGDFSSIKELLSGKETTNASETIKQLENPIISKITTQLGISKETAASITAMALPIIMNMLNNKVTTAKRNGLDVNGMLQKLDTNGGGLLSKVTSLFGGGKNKSTNSIIEQLIKQVL